MRIAVVGSGYVGLVSGACFSETGNHVICVDKDAEKIRMLEAGSIPIFEPGLESMVTTNRKAGRIEFTTDLDAAIKKSQIIFIAVGTPSDEDGSADLSAVHAVAKAIGQAMDGPKIVVDKSTVPVGTAASVKAIIEAETDHHCAIVSNPEFLKEGAAIEDFMRPDRVVIGCDDPDAVDVMRALYAPYMRRGDRLLVMDPASAELTKYAANSMLATRISFMNEIAELCERVGANVEHVRRGLGSDTRIGMSFSLPVFCRAAMSLGKHDPPKPTPGNRKCSPMRTSDAMPRRTWLTLAPTLSQRAAISFMKEMRVASIAFDAYFVISALALSITSSRSPRRM